MIVASWNVNSIGVRLPHVLDWLTKHSPDILCLQELKTVDEKFPKQAFDDIGYHAEFFGEKTYNGVAIISKTTPDRVQKGFIEEKEPFSRRMIECQFDKLTVINVYIPNGQEVGSEKFSYKLKWIQSLKHHLVTQHNSNDLLLICGDFNIATEDRDVYDPIELKGQILLSDQERNAIADVKNWGLVDTFRLHNDDPGQYSWWDYRMNSFKRKMGLRIDHIWVSKSLAKLCTRAWIDAEPRKAEKPSDHAPVAAEFDLLL